VPSGRLLAIYMSDDNRAGSRTDAQLQSEPKREFKGVWIPASLWKRKDLSWLQKCILAEIDSLDKGCFASNGYLAKHMGIAERTLTNNLVELRKKGLLLDWGFNGRTRQMSVADNVSSDPQHTRNRVPSIPKNGYADVPESGTIDTSVVTKVVTNKSKEVRRRASDEEKDRLLRQVEIPKNAPNDEELAQIVSRFPLLKRWRGNTVFWSLKGTKFHLWNGTLRMWEPIRNIPLLLSKLEEKKFSKLPAR